ncbi:stage III sporulation protein AF [Paenibacillus tuaregi]|uniref:stage III sporulation protein AF n=1 Tax=Paenibacillus tuaregi TaxID=1816681 RepID=UPI000838B68B|nr:stage III sporulation protein AF [Paenibacillus tuaregi]
MSWLGAWLKEIIFVVLLAGFIDLLLPNRSFERYVKLVVSLLILLTLMSPLVKLIGGNPVLKLQTALGQSLDELDPDKMNQAGTQQIIQQGLALRKKQEAETLQRAGEEVGREMKQQIESKTGIQIQRVEVALAVDSQGTKQEETTGEPVAAKPEIKEVHVYVSAEQKSSSNSADQQEKKGKAVSVPAISQVEKVEVRIGEAKTNREDQGTSSESPAAASAQGEQGNRAGLIMEQLTKEWGISRTMVKIHEETKK